MDSHHIVESGLIVTDIEPLPNGKVKLEFRSIGGEILFCIHLQPTTAEVHGYSLIGAAADARSIGN